MRNWKLDGGDNDAIRCWLANPANVGNCDDCPYNLGRGPQNPWGLPCGQQNCWVEINCEEA